MAYALKCIYVCSRYLRRQIGYRQAYQILSNLQGTECAIVKCKYVSLETHLYLQRKLISMKTDKDLDSILRFMLRADKLKEIERTGWLIAKIQHPEHDGDHSYSTAALSYLIAKRMGLNAERCAVMGLFHDINEVITGDIATRSDKSLQTVPPIIKRKLERQNELKLAAILNKREKNALRAVLDEYYAQRTEEARLVKQVDKLDYIVQIMLYHKKIKSEERVEDFFRTAGWRIDIPEVRYIFEKIKKKVYTERGMRLPGASAFQKKRYQ